MLFNLQKTVPRVVGIGFLSLMVIASLSACDDGPRPITSPPLTTATSFAPRHVPIATPTPTNVPPPITTATPTPTNVPPPIATATPTPTNVPPPIATATPTPTNVPPPALTPLEVVKSSLPWANDAITNEEMFALTVIRQLLELDMALAEPLMKLPWLSDGIASGEHASILIVRMIAELDTALAGRLLELPWITDGITDDEAESLGFIFLRLAEKDAALAREILEMDFVSSATGTLGRDVIFIIGSLAQRHPDGFRRLIEQPWFVDGLTTEEVALMAVLPAEPERTAEFDSLIRDGRVLSGSVSLPLAGEVGLFMVRRSPFSFPDNTLHMMEAAVEGMEDVIGVAWPGSHATLYLVPILITRRL